MSDFKREFDDIIGDIVGKSDSVTYVCFVMDHSGSMNRYRSKSKENFNKQLEDLKFESDTGMQTFVTVVDFDSSVMVKSELLIEDMEPLEDYWIGGRTALYDAIATGIGRVKRLISLDPRKDKAALIIVQTDGEENDSQEFSGEKGRKQINKMIKELEGTGEWTFVFLAEGIDKELATGLGFSADNTLRYAKSESGLIGSLNATRGGIKTFYAARASGKKAVRNFYDDALKATAEKEIKRRKKKDNMAPMGKVKTGT